MVVLPDLIGICSWPYVLCMAPEEIQIMNKGSDVKTYNTISTVVLETSVHCERSSLCESQLLSSSQSVDVKGNSG